MSEPNDVGSVVLGHVRETGHSVIWDVDGTVEDAHCQQCTWPNNT